MSKKINKKKIAPNNYKIESLEPRLMMDAAIDYAQFVDNYDQVDSIVETQLNSLQSPDLSDLGIEGRIQSIKDSLGDLGSDAETALGSLYAQLTSRLQLMAEDQGVLKDDQNNIVSVDAQTLKNTLNQLFIENSDQLASLNIGYEATQNGFKLTYSPEAELIALPQEGLSSGGYISGVGSNNNLGASAKLDIVFDLSDADGNGLVDSVEPASVVVRDVKAIIENVGGTAKFMNLSVSEESDSDTDLLLKYSDNASGTSSAVHLEFSVDASSNDNFPFAFLGNIGVDKEETGAISVSVPEMQLKNDPQFEIFSLEKALNTISSSFSTIPFIRDFEFGPEENKKKIVEYVENLQEYWADVALAINGAIKNVENTSNYSLDLNNVKSFFDIILPNAQTVLSSVLGNLKLEDANGQEINFLESVTTSLNAVNLSTTTPTSLYLTLSPKIENIAGSLNFGLLELSGLDVDCTMSVKLDVRVDANDNTLIFDGFSLDKFNLTVSKEGIEDPLSLGLFSATVVNGNFKLEVKYDSNNERGLEADPTFTVESLILKSGAVEVAKLPQKENDVYRFGYDSLTENWVVPDEIKAFASLSGETLSHQVVAYLQSMQTALRKQLEDNVKMDFLGGSVGEVVNVIDRIDKVVFGSDENAKDGLLKVVEGSKYIANFSSVEEFVLVFNEAWERVFGESNACSLFLLGDNSPNPISMLVSRNLATKELETSLPDGKPENFEFENFRLVFNLLFTESKDFDLNLAKSFGEGFANVVTYGNVSAGCSAGISFSLDVNFEYQTINDGNGDEDATTLEDIFGANYVANNETCYESIVFDSLSFNPTRTDVKLDDVPMPTFAFTFKVDDNLVLVNSDDIKTSPFKYVDKVDGKENEFVSLTATSLPMIEYNENIKKLIITSDNKFDIESSGNADAFSELKLVNTVQQTCFAASFGADSTLTLALCGVGNVTNVEINLNKNKILDFALDLKNKGMSDTDDWEKCLDKYLSLQKSKEDQFGLNGVLSTGSLEAGRSIKNTYGLYVVDINESTGEILFGCDPSLIKGYKTKRDGNEIKIDSDYYTLELNSGFKYMRMSGVLNASGAIGNVAIEVSIPSLPDGISIEVDSKNCLTLENLADKIYETIKNTDVDSIKKLSNFVKSVVVINDKIVFSVADGVSISSSKLGISNASQGDSSDFKVIYTGGPDPSVDFETLCSGLTKTTSVVDVVEAINNIINPKAEGSTERDFTKPTLYWNDADGNAMDHLEFRSQCEFSLVNVGASKVLEMLGFTAMKSSCCGENDYRIVGRTLLGIDWSKLINFADGANVSFTANLTFEIGKDVKVGATAPSLSLDQKTRTIVLISPVGENDFVEGGFIKNGDEYFRIVKLNRNSDEKIVGVVVSAESVRTEDSITTVATWAANANLKYVAAVDATFAFVDANLVASGSVSANMTFMAEKSATPKMDNDSFLSNWDFTATCDATSDQFVIGGVVKALGKTVYLGDNTITLVSENNGLPTIETNFGELTSAITSEFANLTNFSVQNVYALLDGLVGRLTEIAKNSNVKIPVINKSVGDLVNVANDIRDIVSKLRNDNITSLQGLSDRLNKYLTDFKLMVPQNLPQELEQSVAQTARAFDIKVVGTDIVFDINISKAFSAVHQFNFGGTTGGISGNANLKVTGDFWFNVSAKMTTGDSFDFILEDSVKFGANVNIVGEKLSFNLGIDGGTSNIEGFDALLKNLITVGSDKANSFVVGKAALVGEFGRQNISLTKWELPDDEEDAIPLIPSFVVPMSIFGNLPISVCGYELGNIKFGKWINAEGTGNVICADDINSLSSYLSDVDEFVNAWLSNHNVEPTGSVNVVAKTNQEGSVLGLPEVTLLLKEQQKVDIDSGTLVVDVSGVYERIAALVDGNLDWFDKIKLAVTGLNNLLDSLESSINGGMMSDIKDVPVVGNALSGGVDFLSKLKQQILEPFSNFVYESTGMTAEMVAQKLNDLFGSYAQLSSDSTLLTKLSTENEWHKEGNGVYYKQGSDFAEWFFTLGGTYSFGSDIGLDLGFPGLGLETNAGVDLSLEWKLNFGMKVSKDGGFQFIFYDENDVSVEVKAGMNGKVLGKMAGLGVELDLDSLNKSSNASQYEKGVNLKFGLDIDHESLGNDLVNVNLSDILGQLPTFTPSATVNMVVGLKVGIVSDIKGDAPKFPNIDGQFEFVWSKDEGIEVLGFKDFQLDMGSFIGGVLGPIVSKIQKVVEPLKPLIDFLTTPFPVLDDLGIIITPLSLAKQYCKGEFSDGMVYAIKDLIALSEKVAAFGDKKELKINLGGMTLIGGMGGKDAAEAFLNGNTSISDFSKVLEDASNGYLPTLDNVRSDAFSALSGNGLQVGDGSWKFIWDEPKDIFKLLLGQDIDLVHYNMPKLSFDFDWDTFIRIWAPLGVRLGVSFNASIDLAFGYDTLGIRQWVGSDYKDFSRLLNGFYVDDLDDAGNDKSELSFYGGLKASAELNAGVSAGVGGGVGINVGFNLFDPNKDGKVRLNEIERIFKEEGLFGMFDVEGKITAKLYAYLDLLFYTKKWNITDDITLFEFNYEHTVKPIMISKSGDDVVANIGSNSSSRMSTDDVNNSLDDGDETLNVSITGGNTISDGKDHSETIDGTKGKFIVNAENGNDKVIISSIDDADFDIVINGGDGDDYIDLSGLTMKDGHVVYINGGAGADTIIGAQGLNIIFGDTGVIRVDEETDEQGKKVHRFVAEAKVDANKAGGDIILGGSDRDIIFGGAGDDQIDGGKGDDYIIGDGGTWSVAIDEEFVSAISDDEKNNMTPEEYALRVLHNARTENDLLTDTALVAHTEISLSDGGDTLIGGEGNDEIHGGGGDDHIDGGAGNDLIHGGKGHDRILGGSGNDTIHGGEGMDIVFGDRVANSMDVAAPFAVDGANKTAAFSQEFIEAQFKDGNIVVSPNEFKIKLVDEDGNQLTPFVSELENKYQKNSNGEPDNNLIDNSLIQYSFDELSSRGNDTIYGEDGNDLLFGDGGATAGAADEIYGGIGNDIIDGDGGNDTIKGGIDNDIIYGGAGDDTIDGGAGNDSLYGDEGVEAYDITDARELTRDSDDDDKEQDKLVFGDNLGLHGKIFANAQSNNNESGNDIILTGPGMDFVDGQDGSDTITVKLMGDSTTNYANVTDTGKSGSDVLFVEGTESVDTLLLRRNSDAEGNPGDLGLVALLPMTVDDLSNSEGESTGASETVQNNLNSNIERVNYTQGIDVLNVNGNGGDDRFYIDGTAEMTNVNGGAGNDSFQIGQLYNSERTDDAASARVQPVDAFHTEKTNEESYLSDGVSSDTTLNVEGGSGVDTFAALNNAGTLNMTAGKGDDIFSVYTFLKENGENFDRGAVLLDGDKGFDTLNVRGTDADDVLVVTKEGLLSDMVAIKAAGVESTQFDAAAGDDMFYVVGSKSTDVTELSGGKGNDTFSMGGLDTEYNLRSANTDGQSVDVKYEIVADANATTGDCVMTENFTVVDSDSQPAVFVVAKENGDAEAPYRIQASAEVVLGNENVDATFFIGCAGLAEGQSIDVTISAPMLSNADFNRGDRGFLIGTYDEESNAIVYATTRIVHFTANTVGNPIEVHVKACEDTLIEEGTCKAIAISSKLNSGVVLSKSVTSVGLVFAGEARESAVSDFAARPLVATQEFTVGVSSEFKLNMIPVPKKADGSQGDVEEEEVVETADVEREFTFYVNGEKQDWVIDTHYTLVDNVVKVNDSVFDTLSEGDKLVVSVRSNEMRVDDTRVALAYEDVLVSSVLVDGAEILPTATSGRYYELNGNIITFYDALTKRPTTIHGVVRVEAEIPEEYDWETFGQGDVAAVENQNESLLTIEAHASVLAESGASSFTSVSYDVTYNKPIAEGETVYVKITPAKLLANSGAEEDSQRLSIACDDFTTQEDGSIVVSFNSSTLTRSLTITTVSDGEQDEYGLTKAQKQSKVINEIDGPVYAYGFGKSIDLNAGDPAMLKYKHVIETKDGVRQASNFNELNNFAEDKLYSLSVGDDGHLFIDLTSISDEQKAAFGAIGVEWDAEMSQEAFLAQFEGKTFKWVVTTTKDVGTAAEDVTEKETSVAAEWSRIKEARSFVNGVLELVLDEAVVLPSVGEKFALISGNRDSLFVDEMASVDRLFVNNQQDSVDARASLTGFVNNNRNEAEKNVDAYDSHAVRFTHTELEAFPEKQLAANDDPLMMQSGITAAQMEYAEYNLGKGKDTVDINKTLYREDAYRTYTVVNTGNVAEDSTAGFGAHLGDAGIAAENAANGASFNDGVYHYGLTPIANNGVNVVREESDTKVYYVEAIIKKQDVPPAEADNFVTQRREVKGSFSNQYGFDIEYDFILAEGEYIDGFRFYQAEFDDDIKVNSYQADHTGSLICSGTISSQQPELNQGAVTYSYIIDSDDSSLFVSRMEAFDLLKATADNIHKDAPNGYEFTMFVDATLSDGSVQRRAVSELTSRLFSISRDFTLTAGISIVSLKFAYGYEGDGQLVINAQSGHDRIDASSTDVTRNDMVAFGGLGDDHISMNKGGIAFGDRGQVLYDNGQVNGVDIGDTVLGSTVVNIDTENPAFIDDYTTGIGKTPGRTADEKGNPVHRLQTDGVNRDAYRIQSVDAENGGSDMIKVGGTNSVVVGGAENDVIVIGGDKNVALGDNGRVKYNNAGNDEAVYGDKLGLGMHIVETTNDSIGGVDNIVIAGDKNVAMGGAEGDSIRITGADNVAIGDGGRYTIEETRLYAESKSEQHGGQDFISTGDGKNAVIGGTDNDVIRTGAGNDAIVGDGGKVIMDTDRNALMVSNEGYNVGTDLGTAGVDDIDAGNGDNV
ncbi:Ca2+-binding protein, RTX toxin-related, partial [Fibrobacter sp. UWT2]